MTNGEYRVGLSSASKAIGYSEKWLRLALNRSEAKAKALQGLGFGGKFLEVVRESNQGNSFTERNISLDDFNNASLVSKFIDLQQSPINKTPTEATN